MMTLKVAGRFTGTSRRRSIGIYFFGFDFLVDFCLALVGLDFLLALAFFFPNALAQLS